ncbi:alpha/beta fold hydrolase [Streptomyces diastatochromogenes]|nr:alpha/beta fold hydrolase [Streptomyces diastatochromogenes]
MLRAALGERRLTYVGWSYGTSLGTSYAEQFPRRVRAMVLDGAIDPSLDWRQRALGQSAGFRDAVEEYAESCADTVGEGCPGKTPREIRALIDRLLERTRRAPLPVDGSEDGLDASGLIDAPRCPCTRRRRSGRACPSAARGGRRDGTKLAALAAADEEAPTPNPTPVPGPPPVPSPTPTPPPVPPKRPRAASPRTTARPP